MVWSIAKPPPTNNGTQNYLPDETFDRKGRCARNCQVADSDASVSLRRRTIMEWEDAVLIFCSSNNLHMLTVSWLGEDWPRSHRTLC